MAESKKFGTFGGVFTPSILTILGVILYLRMGWVVGNAGLWGTMVIIFIAHLISVATGLSISSIATDKKVGAGGVYYVLSRSLGLPIGGALGMTLFVATAFSIALYMVGFAEIFNEYFHIGYIQNKAGEWVQHGNITNSYRLVGSIGLLILTIIAFISTSIAIKSQYIILTAIVLSLVSIFLGNGEAQVLTLSEMSNKLSNVAAATYEQLNSGVSFAAIFAIFFPAVTGFTAGVAMSGDLKDPKKAIPAGTMGSIIVGLIVYLGLGLFLYYMIDSDTLINDPKALFNWAMWGILVYFGVWGATLSSALGGILGGPRILQAMSMDKLTPKIFAKGVGASNEPRNALILTVLIAEAGILIGDLNIIAEVVSMFYLAAYGFINLSFYLESWASSDFNPTFRVKKWVGLSGFILTFTIMSQLNLLAMVAAFLIIGGIYFFLSRKQIALGTGDIWQSVWSTVVKKGLKRMEAGNDHKRNWKPNILLFSTENEFRTKLIEFSKAVSGQAGIITNFDLHENPEAKVLFPKSKETVIDDELQKYGIFGRKLEVQNVFKGIESIACTFGFSGIEPNAILMNWPGETNDPKWFTEMTEKLIALDYNVLYLDYDKRWGFRKKEKIDLWWRGVGNNAELMLSLAKFVTNSPDWSQANIRILLVNDTNVDFKVVENRIQSVVDQFRVNAEIKVVNNEVDKKSIYDLMKMHSGEADLVFVGIPEIDANERTKFVNETNSLVSTIGTTLLVRASSQFDETDLKLEHIELSYQPREIEKDKLTSLIPIGDANMDQQLAAYDQQLDQFAESLIVGSIQKVEQYHQEIFAKVIGEMDAFLEYASTLESTDKVSLELQKELDKVHSIYEDALQNKLPLIYENLEAEMQIYTAQKENLLLNFPKKVSVELLIEPNGDQVSRKRRVHYQSLLQRIWYAQGIKDKNTALLEFGYQNLIALHQTKNILNDVIWELLANIKSEKNIVSVLTESKVKLDNAFQKVNDETQHLANNLFHDLRNAERNNLNQFAETIVKKKYQQLFQEKYPPIPTKEFKAIKQNVTSFPSYWYRNLILFTYHLQADIYLISYTTKIQGLIGQVKSYTEENYLIKIQENINGIEAEVNGLISAIDASDNKEVLGAAVRLSEELFFNSAFVINKLIEGANEMITSIPEEVELMTARSINTIREFQGEEIMTEKIALQDITGYLVRTRFIDPLHERIQIFYEQLKRITGHLINTTVQIQKGIDLFAVNNKVNGLKDLLVNAKSDLEETKLNFLSAKDWFKIELRDRQANLREELNINQIIEQVENLRQYVKLQKRRNSVIDGIKKLNKTAGKQVGSVFTYLAKKQRDISAVEYKNQYSELLSEQGLLAEFVESIQPKTELPFYYQQLFAGTHYSESSTLDNRKEAIASISRVIRRIDSGKSGSIMILGGAGTGKTYLTSHISNHFGTGNVYKIIPPVRRTWTKDDFVKSLQRATGIDEAVQKVFHKMPEKSIVIIENIEQWWLKSEGGNEIINEISKLINKFGTKHYFILTSNIHAFKFVSYTTTIQNAIIQSVILTPFTPKQVKDVLWTRHQTGGLRIEVEGETEQHISVNKFNKFLGKFYVTSGGNIGLALNQWINAVEEAKDSKLIMKAPVLKEIPVLADEKWKNLIFQLFIHANLSREELYRIYGNESKNWINRILQSLKNAGFVEQNERGEFVLIKAVKPYVEIWLDEIGFIK